MLDARGASDAAEQRSRQAKAVALTPRGRGRANSPSTQPLHSSLPAFRPSLNVPFGIVWLCYEADASYVGRQMTQGMCPTQARRCQGCWHA